MPNWKKLIVSGSDAALNSLNVSSSITGSTLQLGNLGAENEILIVGNNNEITSSGILTLDPSSKYVGINQTNPEVTLHMTGEGEQSSQIRIEQYNNTADAPDIRTRKARGTEAVPLAPNAGDYLFRQNIERYNGSSFETMHSQQFDLDDLDATKGVYQLQTNTGGGLVTRYAINSDGNHEFTGTITGSALQLSSIVNAGTDTDKFLVLDGNGNVDFRTGAEVRSDIGAGTGDGTVTGTGANNQVTTWNGPTSLDGSSNFTYDGTTLDLTYTGTGDLLRLTSTDAGASSAPDLTFCRNSASPADNDTLGTAQFWGKSTAANKLYAAIYGRIACATSGQTKGNLSFKQECDNVFIDTANFSPYGLYVLPPSFNSMTTPGIGLTVTGGVSGSTTLQIGSGHSNTGTLSSIAGGTLNTASGACSFIGGGNKNQICLDTTYSFIGGGCCNRMDSEAAYNVIVGGENNFINSYCYNSLLGGKNNTFGGEGFHVLVGGQQNCVGDGGDTHASLVGGQCNCAYSQHSFIGGGFKNSISELNQGSVIVGGNCNILDGDVSSNFIGGGASNRVCGEGSNCNFIGGGSCNYITATLSTIVGGTRNTGSGACGFIGGGCLNNICSGETFTVIGGGRQNLVDGDYASIVGGRSNTVDGDYASIVGGCLSTVSGYYSLIVGGSSNTITSLAYYSSIVGGTFNTASGACGFIGGGCLNNICSGETFAAIVGGRQNLVDGDYSSIVGGTLNTASAGCSFIGGGTNNLVDAGGGLSSIVGGKNNCIRQTYSFIGSGFCNDALGIYGFIGTGFCNKICNGKCYNVITGGSTNSINSHCSSIVGGAFNTTSGNYSFIGGGSNNTVSGVQSTIGGGVNNTLDGSFSGILGGRENTITHDDSFAIGAFLTSSKDSYAYMNNICLLVNSGEYSLYRSGSNADISLLQGFKPTTSGSAVVYKNNADNLEGIASYHLANSTVLWEQGYSTGSQGIFTIDVRNNNEPVPTGTTLFKIKSGYTGNKFSITQDGGGSCATPGIGNVDVGPSFNFGNNSYSNGSNALAIGAATTAWGDSSFATGILTLAEGQGSAAFNLLNEAIGGNSVAFGNKTKACGQFSATFGQDSIAGGINSLVIGEKSIASGSRSFASGFCTKACNNNAVSFGFNTQALGPNSFAGGYQSTASNASFSSFAFGECTKATGINSVAFGKNTLASGNNSITLNANSIASSTNSTAIAGGESKAEQTFAHVGISCAYRAVSFQNTVAAGQCSFSVGDNNRAEAAQSVVFGKNNCTRGRSRTHSGNK